MNNPASNTSRVLSIDVFRGIIIFTMVFVNELAGIADVPQWMKHLPADVNGMTFVDLVFPAFLFIVGMSVPFAIQARASKGDSALEIFKHITLRSLGLIVIGVFMVNAESGYDATAMGISIPLWTLLMFTYVLLIWSNYPKTLSPAIVLGAKLIGVAGLVLLWWMYKGPNNTGMTTQWWGILGLIGWAYLIAGSLFLLTRQFGTPMMQFVTLATVALLLFGVFFVLDNIDVNGIPVLQTLAENNNNHTHAAIVLLGVTLSQLFYLPNFAASKFKNYLVFTGAIAVLAFACWQVSPISKVWATPSWALFSVLFCSLIFGAVYWVVDVKQRRAWTVFFEPSATNPLLVYILPFILLALCALLGFYLRPAFFNAGVAGILWSLGFACVIMGVGAGLTRMGLRVKL